MHIDIIPNRTSKPTVLLRESYREGNKVKKRTLANLSSLPMDKVEMIRQVLRGDVLMLIPVPQSDQVSSRLAIADMFKNIAPDYLRHVQVFNSALKRLGMDKLIGSRKTRENINSMMSARKSGLGSSLAAAYHRRAAVDTEFKVR
jgi:hypothetical protein